MILVRVVDVAGFAYGIAAEAPALSGAAVDEQVIAWIDALAVAAVQQMRAGWVAAQKPGEA